MELWTAYSLTPKCLSSSFLASMTLCLMYKDPPECEPKNNIFPHLFYCWLWLSVCNERCTLYERKAPLSQVFSYFPCWVEFRREDVRKQTCTANFLLGVNPTANELAAPDRDTWAQASTKVLPNVIMDSAAILNIISQRNITTCCETEFYFTWSSKILFYVSYCQICCKTVFVPRSYGPTGIDAAMTGTKREISSFWRKFCDFPPLECGQIENVAIIVCLPLRNVTSCNDHTMTYNTSTYAIIKMKVLLVPWPARTEGTGPVVSNFVQTHVLAQRL